MLRDNLVELIEPMLNSAGTDPLALCISNQTPASDDRLPCLKNPRPEGAESSLTENVTSPFQAEPAHNDYGNKFMGPAREVRKLLADLIRKGGGPKNSLQTKTVRLSNPIVDAFDEHGKA